MVKVRPLTEDDKPALQRAIDADTFHLGEWKVEHFFNHRDKSHKVTSEVIEDSTSPIAFVRFTKTLRISCVWNDTADNGRNARAIIHGIRDAVIKARASGFSEIIITTNHRKLAEFFTQVIRMTKSGDEFILAV